MLTAYKDRFKKVPEFFGRIFIRLGFSPNGVTLLSLALGWLTSVFYVWHRNAVLFGILIVVWGLFDAVDGAVARLSNRVTKFGAYLDAMCDRLFEAAAGLAAAYVSGYWVLSFLLVVGTLLVSYAKARAAMEVTVSNNEWPDFMERTERGVLFIAGLILWGLFPAARIFGKDIFFWTLAALNLAVYGTLVQRILRARRFITLRQ